MNGAESAKGEAGEEEEWRYGPVRSTAAACGRHPFHLTRSCRSEPQNLRLRRRFEECEERESEGLSSWSGEIDGWNSLPV